MGSFSYSSSGVLGNGSAAAPSLTFGANTDRGIYNDTGNSAIGLSVGGTERMWLSASALAFPAAFSIGDSTQNITISHGTSNQLQLSNGGNSKFQIFNAGLGAIRMESASGAPGVVVYNGGVFGWANANRTDVSLVVDTALARQNAAGTLGLVDQNSLTTPTAFRVYGTTDNLTTPVNAEWFEVISAAGTYSVGTNKLGTGTARAVNLRAGGTTGITINTGGDLNLPQNISTYKNIATVGYGVPAIQATGRVTAQTGAAASIATFTPTADSSFWISGNILMTAFTAGSVSMTVTYTSEDSTARTLTLSFESLAGTQTTAPAATGAFEGVLEHIRVLANTAITVQTTVAAFTGTYNAETYLVRIG